MFTKQDSLKVKGIGIMLLLFHHLYRSDGRLSNINTSFLSEKTVQNVATSARICVWIFAFISAYGLAHIYINYKGSPVVFVAKRWFSLMSSFWIIYIIAFALSFFLFKNPMKIYKGKLCNIIFDFFALSDFLGKPTLNSVWWYMCFAQVLLILIPFLVDLSRKYGLLCIFILYLSMFYLSSGIVSEYGGSYIQYSISIMFGVIFAEKKYFEKINNKSFLNALLLLMGILFCFYLRVVNVTSNVKFYKTLTITSAVAAVLICIFVKNYIQKGLLSRILEELGKHSGNIFMTHTFLYTYYPKFVYASHNVLLSWAQLTAVCLIISVFLERIKEVIGYNRLFVNVGKQLEKLNEQSVRQ